GWRRRRRCAAGAAAQIPDSGVGSARSGIGAAAVTLISAASARTGRAGGAAGSRGRAARRTRIVPGGTSEQNVTLIEIMKKLSRFRWADRDESGRTDRERRIAGIIIVAVGCAARTAGDRAGDRIMNPVTVHQS